MDIIKPKSIRVGVTNLENVTILNKHSIVSHETK